MNILATCGLSGRFRYGASPAKSVYHVSTVCESGHDTYVHHLAIDSSGRYLATCSSDRKVHVFAFRSRRPHDDSDNEDDEDEDDEDDNYDNGADDDDVAERPDVRSHGRTRSRGEWAQIASLQDHSGTVHRVAWSHPEEGAIHLASCGVDRRVNVYRVIASGNSFGSASVVLVAQCEGAENADTISDVAFAPPNQSFPDTCLFAVASLDGNTRLYSLDGNKKLSFKYSKICPIDDTKSLGFGSWVPNWMTLCQPERCRRGTEVGATGSVTQPLPLSARDAPQFAAGVTSVSWMPKSTEVVPTLAVGTLEGTVDVYQILRREKRSVRVGMHLECPKGSSHSTVPQLRLGLPITVVAWAPTLGRDYDLIACGTREVLCIVKVSWDATHGSGSLSPLMKGVVFSLRTSCSFASWDATATMLAVAGDRKHDDVASSPLAVTRPQGRDAADDTDEARSNPTLKLVTQTNVVDQFSWRVMEIS